MYCGKNIERTCTSIRNCYVAHNFYNPTPKAEGSRMLMLSAGHQQENVVGKWLAFTRIKPMTKDYVSSGSNLHDSTALLFWVRCRKSTANAEIIGENKNIKKNL